MNLYLLVISLFVIVLSIFLFVNNLINLKLEKLTEENLNLQNECHKYKLFYETNKPHYLNIELSKGNPNVDV